MDEPTPAQYQAALADYLKATHGLFEYLSTYTWESPADAPRPVPVLQTLVRAVFCRQHEALSAVQGLSDLGRGYLAALLLRPACEELIYLTYLAKIDRVQAKRFVLALAQTEVARNLKAQGDYAGEEGMLEIGFSARFLAEAERDGEAAKQDLHKLADELAWPERPRPVPSVRFLAKQGGLLAEYDFLYHASSRFVHFNATELMRRAWGQPGSVTISSEHFEDHWALFSAYWGLWIHLSTTLQVIELLEETEVPDVLDRQELLKAMKQLGGRVPLVTAVEFVWPGRSLPWE